MVYVVWDSLGGGGRQYRTRLLDVATAACYCREMKHKVVNVAMVAPCHGIRQLGEVKLPALHGECVPLAATESVCALSPS